MPFRLAIVVNLWMNRTPPPPQCKDLFRLCQCASHFIYNSLSNSSASCSKNLNEHCFNIVSTINSIAVHLFYFPARAFLFTSRPYVFDPIPFMSHLYSPFSSLFNLLMFFFAVKSPLFFQFLNKKNTHAVGFLIKLTTENSIKTIFRKK